MSLTGDINVPDIDDPVEAVDSSGGEVVEAKAASD